MLIEMGFAFAVPGFHDGAGFPESGPTDFRISFGGSSSAHWKSPPSSHRIGRTGGAAGMNGVTGGEAIRHRAAPSDQGGLHFSPLESGGAPWPLQRMGYCSVGHPQGIRKRGAFDSRGGAVGESSKGFAGLMRPLLSPGLEPSKVNQEAGQVVPMVWARVVYPDDLAGLRGNGGRSVSARVG
jgi:hypothetical protein